MSPTLYDRFQEKKTENTIKKKPSLTFKVNVEEMIEEKMSKIFSLTNGNFWHLFVVFYLFIRKVFQVICKMLELR